MKTSLSLTALLLFSLLSAASLPPKILAFAEKNSAVYKVGEKIRFQVWLFQPKDKNYRDPNPARMQVIAGKKLDYELIGDGNFKKRGSITTDKKPVIIECSLDRPGFMLLKLTKKIQGQKKPIVRWAGAAVEPEKIVSGTTMPADFEAYWQKRIAQMRAKKPVITVREVPERLKKNERGLVRVYDVRIADGTINATGILTVPRYPAKKKMPVIITFGGASWIGASPRVFEAVSMNSMVFLMNIHDTKNSVANRKEIQAFRRTPEISGYAYRDLTDMDKYRPGKIFLRIVRCLDYLKTRPEWDKKNLIATGPSFGGCQSIVAAALDKDVTLCFPGGAAMCDHLGYRNKQADGWPKLLSQRAYRGPKEVRALAEKNSAYFDAANMARLIKCPTVFAVGFIDTTCHPTSVYAAFNNVPHKNKSMIHGTRAAHGGSLKQGERGAFGAAQNPLYFEACNGKEMIINRDFRYISDKLPYAWRQSGKVKATVSGSPEKGNTVLSIPAGTTVSQFIRNVVRPTDTKAVLTGRICGKGSVIITFSGQRITVKAGEKWTDFKQVFDLHTGKSRMLSIRSNGDIKLKGLSLQY